MHLPVHARVPAGLSIDLLHNQPRRGVAAIEIPDLALLPVKAVAMQSLVILGDLWRVEASPRVEIRVPMGVVLCVVEVRGSS